MTIGQPMEQRKIKCVPPEHSSKSDLSFLGTQMKLPTITITTTESVYYLAADEYFRAFQNGLVDYLGAEEILSVVGEMEVDLDWVRDGF
ncbi:hypothetical protein [Gimesia maris]|uniref:hypothetical protein n=1 Tax=Gimesia maris TaxID=122 RepID=UPI0032ECD416